MFDAPMDGFVVWASLSVVSLAVAGVALSLAGPAPPDAAAVADAIDEIASSQHQVADTVRIRARMIRIATSQISLRGPGGTTHASLVAGAVTPVEDGTLRLVLDGATPERVFESRESFTRALTRARGQWGDWQPAPDRLRIRRVSWRGIDATLVG